MSVQELFKKVGQVLIGEVSNEFVKIDENELGHKTLYYVADENTKKYIKEFGLETPQKLIEYFVELGFSSTETIIDSVCDIKDEMYAELEGELKGVKTNINRVLKRENSNEKWNKLDLYQDTLNVIRCKFEKKALLNIQNVCRIDNMGRFERFVKASFVEKNIDSYTRIAKASIEAIFEILEIQFFIADYAGDKDTMNSILEEVENFMKVQMFGKNNISIMHEWALEKDRAFWTDKIRKEYKDIIDKHVNLLEMFVDMREQADLENIIFA